jgi:hypothetical protein
MKKKNIQSLAADFENKDEENVAAIEIDNDSAMPAPLQANESPNKGSKNVQSASSSGMPFFLTQTKANQYRVGLVIMLS